MESNRIKEFLDTFGTRVKDDEESHFVELMMDNHKCVEHGGEQYYIPEDAQYNSDEEVYDYLVGHHQV